MIYGDPKVGKSFGALQLAVAVANGADWLGFPVRKNGKVAYIQLDTPRNMWVTEYIEQLKRSGIDFSGVFFADRETIDCWPFDALNAEHIMKLKGEIESLTPDVVIFDTLRESHSGNENESDDMRNVIANMVAATHPAATIFVHHSKKPNPEYGPDTRNDARGGYHVGRMDTIIRLSKTSAHFVGRMIDDSSVKLERQDNGFWLPIHDGIEDALRAILAAEPDISQREVARRLAASTGRSEQSCRGLIRRVKR